MLQPKKKGFIDKSVDLIRDGKNPIAALRKELFPNSMHQEEMMEATSKKAKEVFDKGKELGKMPKKNNNALENAKNFAGKNKK